VKSFHKALVASALFGVAFTFSSRSEAALQCSLASGVGLNFGNYDDSSSASNDVSTTFSVSCCYTTGSKPTVGTISIAIGASTNSGQINTRQMKNSLNADLMNYQLYFTSFGGTIWGDGVSGGSVFTASVASRTKCNRGVDSIPVGSAIFGRIFAQQAVSAGSYSDRLTITVTP
jgi:spore coat protein U-like protein